MMIRSKFAAAIICLAFGPPCFAAELTISVDSLRNAQGNVFICVFSAEGSNVALFPDCDKGKPVRSGKVTISGGKAVITYSGLKDGVYAVAMIHDENAIGKLDTNFLGLPVEGYGVSNNPHLYGAPEFGQAKFDLAGKKTIGITAEYLL